jgi:hypothetical protein
MNRLAKDKGLANYVVGQFFHLLMKDLDDEKVKEYDLPKVGGYVAAEPEE